MALLSGMLLVAPVGVTFGGPVPVREDTTVLVGNHLRRAGRCLRTFRTLHYGGSLLGLLGGTVMGAKGDLDLLGVGFTGLGYGVSLAAPYYIGSAGKELMRASGILPPPQQLLLEKAGRNLKTHMKLSYLGTAQVLGGTFMTLGGAFMTSIEGWIPRILGILTILTGMRNLFWAPSYIGSAGGELQKVSGYFPPRQAQLIEKAGRDLRTYKSRTHWGLRLVYVGLFASVIGAAVEEEALEVVGSLATLGGGVLVFIAPYSIGTAGERLERAGIYAGVHRIRTR